MIPYKWTRGITSPPIMINSHPGNSVQFFRGAQCCSVESPSWLPSPHAPSPSKTKDPACGGLSLWDWLTPTAVTSTPTQTIQRQYWVELQKVQHSIQSTLDKRRNPDSHVGADGGVGALLPGAGGEVRAQKEAPSSTEEGEACQTGLQPLYREDESAVLQRIITLSHHTHHDRYLPPPPHHHLPFTQQLLSSHDAPRAWRRFLVRSPQPPSQDRRQPRTPSALVGACSAEQPGPRRVRWNSCRRGRIIQEPHTIETGR